MTPMPLHACDTNDRDRDARPYVLWFETLPDGDTATVSIWPRSPKVGVVLHHNHRLVRAEERGTIADAERLGWEWHETGGSGEPPWPNDWR